MSDTSKSGGQPTLREYYRVVPSTGTESNADIDAHLTSLTDLRKALTEDEESSGLLGGLFGGKSGDKVEFTFFAVSTGKEKPVELYYTSDGKFKTLGRRLHAIYPDSFDIEKVHLDVGDKLIKPVWMSKDDFIARLLSDQLYVSPEEVCEELTWGGELEAENDPAELSDTASDGHEAGIEAVELKHAGADRLHKYDFDPEVQAIIRDDVDVSLSDFGPFTPPEDNGEDGPPMNPFDPHNIDKADLPDDMRTEPPEDHANATAGSAENDTDSSAQDTAEVDDGADTAKSPDDGTARFDFDTDDHTHAESEATDTADETTTDEDGQITIEIENDEAVGTALVDPPSKAVPHIIETGSDEDRNRLAGVELDGPTLAPGREGVYARPALEHTNPRATRWYGQEETIKDWMTTLNTATESNPEYESDSQEDTDIESPETIETLFEHLEKAQTPIGFQVVFQARRDWSDDAQRRKENIRSGDFDEPWLEKYVLGGYETDEDRDLKAYEYRRIKLIENKRPKKTFNANVRAITLPPQETFEEDPDNPSTVKTGDLVTAEEDVGALKPLFDPLDGVYYHVTGETAPQDSATGTDLTAEEIAQNFFDHSLVTREDRRGAFTRFNLWNDPKKRPELILNAEELSNFVVIPSGDEMDSDAFRSTGTIDADADHLSRPRPQIYNQLTDGMDIGYAFDDDGFPEDRPTSIPEGVLTNHWAMFGASGAGKSINTNGMLLSLYRNIGGLTVLVDPKAGDMVENYAKSHAATFGDLKDVRVFNVPEVLPAIPFFDIRPYLYEGMNRDDAIQQKVDEFHLVMEMVDDNYSTAYVARTVLGALIKSQFDAQHGEDSFTLDDLYDAAVEMYADQTIPRVSHQPQVKRILSNQLNNSEQDFKNTMQAVINRLDDLQEDINLYRLFNQNPEWDDEAGTYKTNRKTREQYEEELENTDSDDPSPEPPRSALDFRELLDTDKVILFDTGNFVRDESQQAFSMYILSALWGAVRSRYNDRKSHEDIETTVNLVIEEAAPIVSTELVTNTLIPEAREFGLSLGMVMQFPEQVRKHSDSDTYNELITNVQSKIIGQLEPDDRIAESLAYGDRDKQGMKNKIVQLSGGEWIVVLPAPAFGLDVPQPFSIQSLDIPEGHPEGDAPFNETERRVFYKRYESRKNRVANKFGYRQPSAEEVANRESAGDTVGFEGRDGDDAGEADSQPTPSIPTGGNASASETEADPDTSDSGSSTPFGQSKDEDGGGFDLGGVAGEEADDSTTTKSDPGSTDGSEVADAESQQESQSSDNEPTAATDIGGDTPDFGTLAPLPPAEIEAVYGELTVSDHQDLAAIVRTLLTSLPEDEYHRALLTVSHAAARGGISITPAELHESAKSQVSGEKADTETVADVEAPTGENIPTASDVDESPADTATADTDTPDDAGDDTTAEDTEPEPSDSETSDPIPRTPDADTSSDPDGDDCVVPPEVGDEMFSTEANAEGQNVEDNGRALAKELLEERRATEGESGEQESESTTSSQHPTNVSLETPLQEAYADFTLDRHDDHEFSDDDKQFMAYIAAAFRDELDWYSLTDSMTDLRDRAGDPDTAALIEAGYIDETTTMKKKYYSLTRKGWRVVSGGVPGNEFGDHMEKMEHRLGVYLLSNHIAMKDGVESVASYAEYDGETYDVIGYDGDEAIVVTGEVETESNNPEAVVEDYEKLSNAPGDVVWAHPTERAFSAVWKMINEHALGDSLTVRTIDRREYFYDYLEKNDLQGVNEVETYTQLTDN